MINTDMKLYQFGRLGDMRDEYGQSAIDPDSLGEVMMAIYTTSQSIQQNINYSNAQYIGLTSDANVDDTYIIIKDLEKGEFLKVLYVNREGRLNQVFMGDYKI